MKPTNYRQALIERMGTPVLQKTIRAGNVTTAYLEAGEGEVVICLHGAGAGAVTWYPSIAALAQDFRVIAPDIVGYGESDKPDAPYDKPFFSAWLASFMAALKIPKAHIVGLSQGGAIALQFVLEHPEMVDKLVLVDSGALGAKPTLGALFGMIWLNSAPSTLANCFYSRYILFNPKNRDPNHGHYSVEVIKGIGGKKAFSQGKGAAVTPIPEDSLRQIRHNTLIIWGEEDRLFGLEYGERAARIIPHATLYSIPNAGHLPLMDQPYWFNKALLGFLTDSSDT